MIDALLLRILLNRIRYIKGQSNKLMQILRGEPIITPGSALYDKIFQQGLMKDDEEFYWKFFSTRGEFWRQVVNFSEMTDGEVITLRNEIEDKYFLEKERVFGPKIYKKFRKCETMRRKLAQTVESQSNNNHDIFKIRKKILKLEQKRLRLRGLV